jgi:DNA-binding MarR family transcriptional regulator
MTVRNENSPEAAVTGEHSALSGLVFQLVREQRSLLEARLESFDLTMPQAAVLLRIAHQPGARPIQVASDIGTDTAGMTRLLDRLEAKRLVARENDPADRRSLVIHLTDAGKELAPKLGPIFGSVERDLTAGHSVDEVEQARMTLGRFLDNLRRAARP